ncbi:glycosyltransferase family 4 protein [Salinibius halmophilus]|uniref:glycosyltransferase family 4 protein n=1 Tax=Salinibius halmophilus TaxID=1853216 RepID=UPI000E67374C|nr:glycosyltransferase family 4 protein [Salinibius halmophilus]
MKKVLVVHNAYQIFGGEDLVVAQESELLRTSKGYAVKTVRVGNDQIHGLAAKLLVSLYLFFSPFGHRIAKIAKHSGVDVVHVHNFFPLISPSVFFFCKKYGIPVVFTLHNYRIFCPTATLMSKGKVVLSGLEGRHLWSIRDRVYRGSLVGTIILVSMIKFFRAINFWNRKVALFIALTNFYKSKAISGGLHSSLIRVKPNFVYDPGFEQLSRKGVVFVGRLSPEKGLAVLGAASIQINSEVHVYGEGEPNFCKNLVFKGKRNRSEVLGAMKRSVLVVVPSICLESFGLVIVEAFACGTPVVCSRLGSMAEIVEDGVTGLHFEPGNAEDLAEKVNWLLANPEKAREMGRNARAEYEAKYTPEKNLEMLEAIYAEAIEENRKQRGN